MTMLATPVAAPVLTMSSGSSESSAESTATLDCFMRLSYPREAFAITPLEPSSSSFSFDWSDFPVVGDDKLQSTNFERKQPPDLCLQHRPVIAFDELPSPPCTILSHQQVVNTPPSSSNKKSMKQNHRRRVRFSSSVEVRRLPVRLGDHPLCVGGMALTVGWANKEDENEVVDFESYERHSLKRRMGELRVDYYARRERLIEVTGLTVWELLQLEYEMQFPLSQEEQQDSVLNGMDESKVSLSKHTRQRQRPTMRHAKSVHWSLVDLARASHAQ